MVLIGVIVLILLYVLHDYCVIKSYSSSKYKKYWHYAKFLFIALTFYLIVGFNKDLIAYYLLYYVIFESLLNISLKKPIFYVSKKGSKSDEFRCWLFGEHVQVYEGIMKIFALVIGIIILNK